MKTSASYLASGREIARCASSFMVALTALLAPGALVVQPDGKILVGGEFQTLAGEPATNLGRLNSGGSLDSTFHPEVNGPVRTVVVQPDGKILVGGDFTMLGGKQRNHIGRLFSGDGLRIRS